MTVNCESIGRVRKLQQLEFNFCNRSFFFPIFSETIFCLPKILTSAVHWFTPKRLAFAVTFKDQDKDLLINGITVFLPGMRFHVLFVVV